MSVLEQDWFKHRLSQEFMHEVAELFIKHLNKNKYDVFPEEPVEWKDGQKYPAIRIVDVISTDNENIEVDILISANTDIKKLYSRIK